MGATEINGFCDDRFKGVRDVLAANLDSGEDLGACVAITIEGRPVADFWGGWVDADQTTPWAEDTIVNVWSTTKTMTNLCALMLVDRGVLDVHEKVSTYWPEFAANGKEAVEVRHLLAHTSGVSAWAQPVVTEDLYDSVKAAAMLAAQEPWWEPGTASGYHALNQGHLVGEVVRRIDGRSLGTFFREEVAEPLGADFQIGTGPSDFARISPVIPPPPLPFDLEAMDFESPAVKTLTGPPVDAAVANTAEWRQAEIGAANGHSNARAVARIQAAVANGGELDGVRLLGPDTIELIFDEQANGVDLVLGLPLRFGIGYGLPEPTTLPYLPDHKICFWGGWGGSMIIVDLDHHLTLAYMMNKMAPGIIGSDRSAGLITALYEAIG